MEEISVSMSMKEYLKLKEVADSKVLWVKDYFDGMEYYMKAGTKQEFIDEIKREAFEAKSTVGILKSEINKIKCFSVIEFKKWKNNNR